MITLDQLRRTTTAHWTSNTSIEAIIRVRAIQDYRAAQERGKIAKKNRPEGWTDEQIEEHNAIVESAPRVTERLLAELGDQRYTLQIRATVATYNTLAEARYQALRTEAGTYFAELTGIELGSDFEFDSLPAEQRREFVTVGNAVLAWAAAIPAIVKLETRQIDLLEQGSEASYAGDGWEEQPIPESWKTAEAGIDAMPASLLTEIAGEARAINESLFSPLLSTARPMPASNGIGLAEGS